MGWLITEGATRADIITRRLKGWKDDHGPSYCKTIKGCTVGNVLWMLRESFNGITTSRWIECDLLRRDHGYGWGYKDMDESDGPCYWTCPVSWLDLCTEPINDTAREWRESVRLARRRAASLKKGLSVRLANGLQVTIQKAGRSNVVVRYPSDAPRYAGMLVRVRIVDVVAEPETGRAAV